MTYKNIIVTTDGSVGIIKLNRPSALNALNQLITEELSIALEKFENNDSIGCIVLTGNNKSFAAGADIKEIQNKTFSQVYLEGFITASWEKTAKCRKPIIAAVSGFAIGGGLELALMCDLIIASDTAQFSLPETQIGIIPGAGGTQRLTRIVGKAIAMDMILTGRKLSSKEALKLGLISRMASVDEYLALAIKLAKEISESSLPIVMLAKEAVNKSFETHLSEGIYVERRLLYSTFAVEDRLEGMSAFIEKRPAVFKNK